MNGFEHHIYPETISIREALNAIDRLPSNYPRTLFMTGSSGALTGSLTDGDIRRGLIRGVGLDEPVTTVMNPDFYRLLEGDFNFEDLRTYREMNIQILPVVDRQGRPVRLINFKKQKSLLPIEAVIMAGGEGKRLMPLTADTPKPLLKVGDKPIIEHNIDRLICYGITRIHISIRYKGEKIIDYFGDGSGKSIEIRYIREDEPLGTAGALKLLRDINAGTLLVMNSDLLTNIDFEDFYRTFLEEKADMAVATYPYYITVPYAVMDIDEQQRVRAFSEKPRFTYQTNAGIYLLKKELISLIPDNSPFDATDLMTAVVKSGRKLISFPILGYWLDIGKMDDYQKAQVDIRHLRLD